MNPRPKKIIDTHLHLWNDTLLDYPWIKQVPALGGIKDLNFLFSESTHAQSMDFVFVQAECRQDQSVQEVEWVSKLALQFPQIKGIVAYAPMNRGAESDAALDRLQEYPLVKGIRHHIQLESNASFCWQPEFVRGIHSLVKRRFTFDLCLLHPQIPDVIRLVEQCPENNLILDHFANAGLKEGWLTEWETGIKRLAQFPKVFVKLSGLLVQCPLPLDETLIRRIFEVTMEAFGADRCCFGSDWPVVNLNGSYDQWTERVMNLISSLSNEDQEKILSKNAERFYRLA